MKLTITAFLETEMWEAMGNGEFVKQVPVPGQTPVCAVRLNESEPLLEASLYLAYLGA
ncbi:hypothetical protein [Desulfoscipio geothermicus]|uniref:hypothetical protein n=1 Tax=Desulfoscipio geothermicus TaxID=39060 RepID=UPI001A9690D6|nr:hypothetical protein [Desulfoscipio geothermicus]